MGFVAAKILATLFALLAGPPMVPVLALPHTSHQMHQSTHSSAPELKELQTLYIDTLKKSVTGVLLETPGYMPGQESLGVPPHKFNKEIRTNGLDFPVEGLSMSGLKRLDNLHFLVGHMLEHGIPGDFIECGVWRGGTSLFMRGLLKAHGVLDRTVHLVDSFDGLPLASTPADSDMWSKMDILKVPREMVEAGFERYGLLDSQVQFHKGYFRDSLPVVRKELEGKSIALLRMDGDMYESTMDILFNLMDFVSPGGCVVVDDWEIPVCKAAMKEFFEIHEMNPDIIPIDKVAVYFCIEKKVPLNHEWYREFNARRTKA